MINPSKIKIISPATIHAVTGKELNIYKTNFVRNLFCKYNDNIEFYADIDNTEILSRDEMITLSAASARSESVSLKLFNNYGLEIQTKNIALEILDAVALSSSYNVLVVGDSLTANGQIATTLRDNFIELGGTTPTFVGSKGTAPNNHEGISGASWESFNSETSPFYDGAEINFTWYAANELSGAIIDCITFELGVNDSFVTTKTDEEITVTIQNAKDLIDAYLSYNSNGKVIVVLPTYSVNSADGWGYSYGAAYKRNDYYSNIYNLQSELIETFDESAYSANVFVNIGGFCMDGTDGIDRNSAADKNTRIPIQYEWYNQGVHPYAAGGFQTIADGIYPTLLKVLS